ncbi:hypothetical protein [Kineosporia sp. NBRC 101731]|uniref:hypothetical protein n=1 Tax=Kineosporia sp. NBRC 101731 TaxID=3032199 RepID=UPI0024A37C9C|nr:hypothetical protein [Kineosporia sp. NBRC 101731]GLY32131.1 hypothetical protein Kisp02_54960 [Kineosporia sp. NBRC 101731]
MWWLAYYAAGGLLYGCRGWRLVRREHDGQFARNVDERMSGIIYVALMFVAWPLFFAVDVAFLVFAGALQVSRAVRKVARG